MKLLRKYSRFTSKISRMKTNVLQQETSTFQFSKQCKMENPMSRCVYFVPFVDLECHH